jgi:hypothetical protein
MKKIVDIIFDVLGKVPNWLIFLGIIVGTFIFWAVIIALCK